MMSSTKPLDRLLDLLVEQLVLEVSERVERQLEQRQRQRERREERREERQSSESRPALSINGQGLLTMNEAADLLRVSRGHLYVMVKANRLPTVKNGRRRFIRLADAEAFIGEGGPDSGHNSLVRQSPQAAAGGPD